MAGGWRYDADFMGVPMGAGTWSAALASGRDLPAWLSFDPETRSLSRTAVEPPANYGLARVHVAFKPDQPGAEGFAVELVIDPTEPLDPRINALLAGDPYFAAHGVFVLPVADDAAVTADKPSGFALPDWLDFDPETLTLSGTPPQVYVGAVPVRIGVGEAADGSMPAFSLVRDFVVDDLVEIDGGGISVQLIDNEHVRVTTPEDFNGAIAIAYNAVDVKGAVSDEPAIIVINVEAQRELPDVTNDSYSVIEDGVLSISLADMLADDRDDDGDPIHVTAIGAPDAGTLEIRIPELSVEFEPIPGMEGPVAYSAGLANGSPLPSWLSIDAATGRLFGTPPLAFMALLNVVIIASDGQSTIETPVALDVNGNRGVTLVYTPITEWSGTDEFTYTVSDDREGSTSGKVNVNVIAANDPPVARDDGVEAIEDTALRYRSRPCFKTTATPTTTF